MQVDRNLNINVWDTISLKTFQLYAVLTRMYTYKYNAA